MLLILPVVLTLVTARDVPQLEVLFYSSDEAQPPFTSPLQSGEQLARNQARRKVEVAYKKGFPTPTDFYTNFVERRRPVVFSGAMEDLFVQAWPPDPGPPPQAALAPHEAAALRAFEHRLLAFAAARAVVARG